jgi:upstream activation factor subunit UAF30
MSFDAETLEPAIRRILSAPGVDLQTISAKRVRRELVEGEEAIISADQVKEHKAEIDAVIARVFAKVNSAAQSEGGDAEDGEGDEEEEVTKPKASKASSSSKEGVDVRCVTISLTMCL